MMMKMINNKISHNLFRNLILILSILILADVNAQKKWSLEECVTYAIENNISVRQANNALLSNDQDIIAAKGNFLPFLGINGSQRMNLGNVQVFDGEFVDRTFHSSNFGLNISQTIFNGFRNTNVYRQSLINKAANLEEFKRIKDNVSLTVVNSYLNVLLNKENLIIAEAQYDFSIEQLQLVKELVEAGVQPQANVFDAEAIKLKEVKFLAQGTIYPDVIESSGSESNEARVIKSHHNVGGLPEEMKLDLVEPLRDLFKDEVRNMGIELGIPKEMIERHPFPGPGLGVRIIGEVSKEKTKILQEADNIFIQELIKANLYDKVSQAFAVLLPVKSVGVVGDERRYAEVIALRAVETVDFMTAKWAHLPYELLENVSNRIVNEIEEVSRVVYDISGKPPATIEWE